MTTTPYLDRFTTNLNQVVSAQPTKYGAFGRDVELGRLIRILNQHKKNSAAVLGEAGVGKTALVEELVKRIINQDASLHGMLLDRQVISLELASLMETTAGGSFASNLHHIVDEVKANPKILLFIDEMHELIGTGAEGGSGMDAGNILKPAIGRGEIQVIGATTNNEFRQYIESDNAMERRFDKVLLDEFTPQQTVATLQRIVKSLPNEVEVPNQALDTIINFSDRYMTTHFFPEKAITLLDNALVEAKMNNHSVMEEDDIASIIHERYHVPMSVLTEKDDERLFQLYERMQTQVIGQNAALRKIVTSIRVRAAGLGDMTKPLSFLLAGTPGVGKTETAKAIATHYFGDERQLIRFDMSEFKFAKQSMARFAERAAEAVKFNPYSVLLLDEVEKADPMVLDLLLQILDDGRLTNERGQTINFKDLIVVMTTNIGHQLIIERAAKSDAYRHDPAHQTTFEKNFENALLGADLRQEFISRIGAIIIFEPLDVPDVKRIIDLKLSKLNAQAQRQGYYLIYRAQDVANLIPSFATGREYVDERVIEAHSLIDFLVDKAYRKSLGVRPLDDSILEFVEARMAEAILNERRTGQVNGHSFVFRAWGAPPDATHPKGNWQAVVTQVDLDTQKVGIS
ncbi:AAA family ATPase [Weissella paramesenteroides]|uniref:AAA family ATPase n=1 Tax=Weissella paramesenteroides TaxID=1249 RepID=UPI0013DBF716|nr:AAA family ATPase [Weissella paramesenteroides]NEZ89042.1 ATP-dependent Clp protease ATP-binding subunit [Weissella paramesenteroides]NFB03367.1 ATP-dependent Clp protease ATP-binding subunit [Weissella paramesenteroides]